VAGGRTRRRRTHPLQLDAHAGGPGLRRHLRPPAPPAAAALPARWLSGPGAASGTAARPGSGRIPASYDPAAAGGVGAARGYEDDSDSDPGEAVLGGSVEAGQQAARAGPAAAPAEHDPEMEMALQVGSRCWLARC
jgi:hypothetical protein